MDCLNSSEPEVVLTAAKFLPEFVVLDNGKQTLNYNLIFSRLWTDGWPPQLFQKSFRSKLGPILPVVCGVANRPYPSCKNPQFQNEVKWTTFLVKMSVICMRMKNHFYIKGWALNLVLIQGPGRTWKWPSVCNSSGSHRQGDYQLDNSWILFTVKLTLFIIIDKHCHHQGLLRVL